VRSIQDEDIRGRVSTALIRDGSVEFADRVKVDVEGGRVLLSGTVRSAAEKASAGRIAALVPGVREVVNALTVFTEGTVSDRELAQAAQRALAAADDPAIQALGVEVVDGVAFLEGEVPTRAQEERAKQIVGAIPGMEDVQSRLNVGRGPAEEVIMPADDAALTSFAAGALSEAGIDLRDEQLWAEEGVIHIKAKVNSEEDAQRVIEVLKGVPGVKNVRAQLVVRRSEASADPDEALAARVIHALQLDGRVSPAQVRVSVHQNVVILSGQVDCVDDQNAAVEVAQRVPGVREVINEIIITDRVSVRSDDKGIRL